MAALSVEQKRHLLAHGYVHVPNAVEENLVRRALRAINHDLSNGIDPAQLAIFNSQSFCPTLAKARPILDLFERSSVQTIVESATGPLKPIDCGQVALRWPEALDGPPPPRILWPHIDGTYTPTNGVPEGSILNFTALACVLLSDLPTANAGNFTAWPGSHRILESYYRENGAAALLNNAGRPNLGTPHQITGSAGDLIIAQYLLGHDYSLNLSPNVRYAVFFRLESRTLTPQNRIGSVTDMWRDWSGMTDVIGG
jgi:hypothetical protein